MAREKQRCIYIVSWVGRQAVTRSGRNSITVIHPMERKSQRAQYGLFGVVGWICRVLEGLMIASSF